MHLFLIEANLESSTNLTHTICQVFPGARLKSTKSFKILQAVAVCSQVSIQQQSANMMKTSREEQFEEPYLTDVPKLKLKEIQELMQECLDNNTFNSLAKPVHPDIGDLYIYKCGAFEPVHAIDNTNWKHSHTDVRSCQSVFWGRKFLQHTYVRKDDLSQKKVLLLDNVGGLVIVHYR